MCLRECKGESRATAFPCLIGQLELSFGLGLASWVPSAGNGQDWAGLPAGLSGQLGQPQQQGLRDIVEVGEAKDPAPSWQNRRDFLGKGLFAWTPILLQQLLFLICYFLCPFGLHPAACSNGLCGRGVAQLLLEIGWCCLRQLGCKGSDLWPPTGMVQ